MDASTHANRKGDLKQRKDDKQVGDKDRYEGGRDSDQNRQAKGAEGREGREGREGDRAPRPVTPEGGEEE